MVANETTEPSSTVKKVRYYPIQNYILVWIQGPIQPNLQQLQSVIENVIIYKTSEECLDVIDDIADSKIFIISPGDAAEKLLPDIHNMECVDTIYILCEENSKYKELTEDWRKVQGVFTSVDAICESLKEATRQCDYDLLPLIALPPASPTTETSDKIVLSTLPPLYMYSSLLKDISLKFTDEEDQSMDDFIAFCQEKNIALRQVEELKKDFLVKTPVWWYSHHTLLCSLLNRALRILDIDVLVKMIFFIRHLHKQIKTLYHEQKEEHSQSFTAYRGRRMTHKFLQQLLEMKNGFMTVNGFLLASTNENVATDYVKRLLKNPDYIRVIFIMNVDPSIIPDSSSSFAFIKQYSPKPEENPVLFSMHSMFQIDDIKQSDDDDDDVWRVYLTFTDCSEAPLNNFNRTMNKDSLKVTGWLQIGQLMMHMNRWNLAEQIFSRLLNNPSYENSKWHICHQLGCIKVYEHQYQEAVAYFEQSLKILLLNCDPDDASLVPTYENLSNAYFDLTDYQKALEYVDKQIEAIENCPMADLLQLSMAYEHKATVYQALNDLPKALIFYGKSLSIKQGVVSPDHPSLAAVLGHIGTVYDRMGDLAKSLEYYEQTLSIRQKSLPPNDPLLGLSYGNIGAVYARMSDYPKALEFLSKALEIDQSSLKNNDPDLATSHYNIACVYKQKGEKDKELYHVEKAYEILRQAPIVAPELVNEVQKHLDSLKIDP